MDIRQGVVPERGCLARTMNPHRNVNFLLRNITKDIELGGTRLNDLTKQRKNVKMWQAQDRYENCRHFSSETGREEIR